VVVEEKEAPKEPEIKVDDAISELKKRLKDAEDARLAAERKAREAENKAAKAQNEAEESNKFLVTGAIETLKRDASILKANYKAALASGNYEEAAEIQEKMNLNSNRLQKLEEGKIELEKRPKVEVKPEPKGGDVVEEFASRLSPMSAQWIRNHPECVTDYSKNQIMIGAHTMALGKNIKADTPEYFEFIENALGYAGESRSAPETTSEPLQKSTGGRQAAPAAAPAAAPVSRAASTNGTNRPNVVRLSEAERDIADSLGMTYQEYAKNKLALQKAGKIN
jgi:hypothetical protein